jgi:ubiquinone biosynthesis accessory factor UbiJ
MLSGPALAAINHLLRDADWARARLEPFAGCAVRFEIPPLSAAFIVGTDGRLLPFGSQTEPVTVVRLTLPTLVRLLWLHDDSARKEAQVEGDTALASALTGILSSLRWDVEEDLSQIVGDVAAHRLTQAGSGLLAWQANIASNLAHALAEYWTEEQPLLVSRDALRQFVEAVDILRDDVERLEKRIERLTGLSLVPRMGA